MKPRSILALLTISIVVDLAPLAARADFDLALPNHAALQVMAGDGVTDGEAIAVEVQLSIVLTRELKKRGFNAIPLGAISSYLAAQNIPPNDWHLPGNSPANGARIQHYRELDVELLWMTVLSRDNGELRLAYTAMGFRDLSTLQSGLKRAPSLDALIKLLDQGAAAMVDEALAKFKPVPMPDWWPQNMAKRVAAMQAQAAQAQPPPAIAPPSDKPPGIRLPDGAQVAVLDFKRSAGFTIEDARYLSDVVRAAVLQAAPRLGVMTRENLLVLLQASGKDLSDCEGECEVETGRRIGADAVISGDVLKFGARYKLSLRLHETKGGHLLAAEVASGATFEELDAEVQKRAAELLSGQR